MIIIGVDDAGRGPVIGPMILAGVLIKKETEDFFQSSGVKDSKSLTHKRRIALSRLIIDNSIDFKIEVVPVREINELMQAGTNLNTIEAIKTAKIINYLNKRQEKIKVIVDCPSVNIHNWKKELLNFIEKKENLEVICEHKADINYPSVSAASIIAKVEREKIIESLKKRYGDFGSGYPSDPSTIKFLKENGKRLEKEELFREHWITWKKFFPETKQSTLKL